MRNSTRFLTNLILTSIKRQLFLDRFFLLRQLQLEQYVSFGVYYSLVFSTMCWTDCCKIWVRHAKLEAKLSISSRQENFDDPNNGKLIRWTCSVIITQNLIRVDGGPYDAQKAVQTGSKLSNYRRKHLKSTKICLSISSVASSVFV